MTAEADKQDTPPRKWWQTGFMRSIQDFSWLAQPDVEGAFFRNEGTLASYAQQLKTLEKQYLLFLALSFLGAFVILAGGFPKDFDPEVLGVGIPSSLITLQLVAVFVAMCFVQTIRRFGSYIVLNAMISKLLEVIPHGSEFVVARYDASHLWSNVLRRRDVGYLSPLQHKLANALFSISGLLLLGLHFSIIGTAMWKALSAAWALGPLSFAFLISLTASLSFASSLLLFLLGFIVPMPYQASKEMLEYWQGQPTKPDSTEAVTE